MSQRWRHEEAAAHGLNHRWRHEDAAHGLNHRWRHEDAAHHSALTLRKVCAVIELRREEGAGHSALTLRKVRAVIELRHPVKTTRRRGVGTPIEKAGARFW